MTVLSTQDLTVEVADILICRQLNVRLEGGQRWGILGSNGVGKTTLLHTLANLRSPTQGKVLLNDTDIQEISHRERSRSIGVLFQEPDDPFPATVENTVLIGRHPYRSSWTAAWPAIGKWEDESDKQLASAVLEEVSLLQCRDRNVLTLSGGERQRLAIATVLIQQPSFYLLDEPNNHLDLQHQIELLGGFTQRVVHDEATTVMILHDVNLASRFCDYLILLFGDGEHLIGAKEEMLSVENLSRLYRYPVVEIEQAGRRAFVA